MKACLLTALLLASPAMAQDWSKGTPVTITMTNQGFVPQRIVLRQGRQYVITFRNRSDRGHNFTARSFFDHARVSPRDQAWVREDAVKLDARQSATVHIVAPTTPNARYDFRSTRIEDAGEKMKGYILVR